MACISFGIIIFLLDLSIEREDYSLVNRGEFAEFSDPWLVDVNGEGPVSMDFPVDLNGFEPGQKIILTNQIPTSVKEKSYVFFRSHHQLVNVYVENNPVYSYGVNDKCLFSKTPANAWIMIPLAEYEPGSELRIELTSIYDNYSGKISEIYMSTRSVILYNMVEERFLSVLISGIIFIIGVSMILIAIVLNNKKTTQSLYRLGLLSVTASIWSICISNVLQVVFGNPFAIFHLEFLTYHLLLPAFLWLLLSFDYYKKKKVYILFWCSLFVFLTVEILQISNIVDYMETIILSHIFIGVSFGYFVIDGVKALFKRNVPSEVKSFVISILILISFLAMDIVKFYWHSTLDEGFFTRIGALVFIGLWAVEIIQSISKILVRITRTELLEQIAFTDQMTGINNRRAFEEKLEDYRSNDVVEDAYLVAFDVNNLKYVNDHYGHSKGDYIIKTVADKIQEAFIDIGDCYRIGGDEFFVIIPADDNIEEVNIVKNLEQIADDILEGSKLVEMDFSIASGLARLSDNNRDIDETCRVADGMMYQNKEYMKAKVK